MSVSSFRICLSLDEVQRSLYVKHWNPFNAVHVKPRAIVYLLNYTNYTSMRARRHGFAALRTTTCSFYGAYSYTLLPQLAVTDAWMLSNVQSRMPRLLCFWDEPTLCQFCTHCDPMFLITALFCRLAQRTSIVFASQGVPVYLFSKITPTPFVVSKTVTVNF